MSDSIISLKAGYVNSQVMIHDGILKIFLLSHYLLHTDLELGRLALWW